MKKTTTILLTLLTGLALSNTASANLFDRDFECKIKYDKIDLITNSTKTVEAYKKFKAVYAYTKCRKGSKKIGKKINKWLKKNDNYMVENFKTLECKVKSNDRYLKCHKEYSAKIYNSIKYSQRTIDLMTGQ
jgi:hypothetical protein